MKAKSTKYERILVVESIANMKYIDYLAGGYEHNPYKVLMGEKKRKFKRSKK
ncbi:MAG: hypothetical protein ACFFEN_14365 [Candidatus Thorarchaeota archaeon]